MNFTVDLTSLKKKYTTSDIRVDITVSASLLVTLREGVLVIRLDFVDFAICFDRDLQC